VSRCVVVVAEYEQVVMTEFGDPVGNARTTPGLYWALPWYEVRRFSKRLMRWDGDRAQVPTKDKRFIWVDATARWQIIDSLKFYQSVHDFTGAQTRLDDVIDSAVRQVISDNNLIEAVRPDTRPVAIPGMSTQTHDELVVVKGRDILQKDIVERARALTRAEYGIDLVDVRLKRLNYIEAVQQNVFGRMIAERQKVAEQYRSEGKGRAAEIQGSMERKLQEIRSEAYRKSREIQGNAEAESTRIYAEAYNRDPEFYAFLQTLETYPALLGQGRGQGTHTGLVLSTDSELLGYLRSAKPPAPRP
jgi:membrane protease subunit HflC